MHIRTLYALVLAAALSGCVTTPKSSTATAPSTPSPATAVPVSAFEKAMLHDHIIVTGQPTLDDLKSLRERGITHVFNVRTAEEMNPEVIGFDEVNELATLGIGYSNQPISAAASYTPALLEAFAKQVAATEGKILLHCTVGNRASQVYAAYAMKYLGLSPDAAMRTMGPIGNWPLTLERLTGEPLAVVRREDLSKEGFED